MVSMIPHGLENYGMSINLVKNSKSKNVETSFRDPSVVTSVGTVGAWKSSIGNILAVLPCYARAYRDSAVNFREKRCDKFPAHRHLISLSSPLTHHPLLITITTSFGILVDPVTITQNSESHYFSIQNDLFSFLKTVRVEQIS